MPPKSAARAPQEQTLHHHQVDRSREPCPVLPSLLVSKGSGTGSSRAPPHPKPSLATHGCSPVCLPSALSPVSSSSSCKPHQTPPPQMSPFISSPARNGGWGLGADLICPEHRASLSPLSSSSGLGLPAPRAQNEASWQKRPGWQRRPASCGGMGTGTGRRLPRGRGQGHMSSWQIWCPPPNCFPEWGPPASTGSALTALCPRPPGKASVHILDNTRANESSGPETGSRPCGK